jgi:hypothetical protein
VKTLRKPKRIKKKQKIIKRKREGDREEIFK